LDAAADGWAASAGNVKRGRTDFYIGLIWYVYHHFDRVVTATRGLADIELAIQSTVRLYITATAPDYESIRN